MDPLTIGSLAGGSLLAFYALAAPVAVPADAGPEADRRRAELVSQAQQRALWTGAAGALLLLYGARRARWI